MPTFPELEKCILKLIATLRNREKIVSDLGGAPMMQRFAEVIGWRTVDDEQCDCCVAAVDSSFAAFETRLCVLYVVQGLAMTSSGVSVKDADAGMIFYTPSVEQAPMRVSPKRIVSAIAQLVELDLVLRAVKQGEPVDYVLLDGSALSFLLSRVGKVLPTRIVESIAWGRRVDLKTICREKLVKLIELADRAVFVAKSSALSLALGLDGLTSMIPDLSVLELARLIDREPLSRAGYSRVFRVRIGGKLAKSLGLDSEDLDLLRSSGIDEVSVLYVRMRDGAPAFQVSFLGSVDEDRVRNVIRCLMRWSPIGYPIPLESVHRLSKISRKLVKNLLRSSTPAISGREVIEL